MRLSGAVISAKIVATIRQEIATGLSALAMTAKKAEHQLTFDGVRRNMKLYVYAKPNTMDGYLQNGDCHNYTDDVALCYANSLEEACYSAELLGNTISKLLK